MFCKRTLGRLTRALVGLMTVAAVWLSPGGAAEGSKPLVILVGIDGFRADYLARGQAPTLGKLARQGATARGLTPVFPTVTFPNHVSLVTGRRPAGHGILNNTMWDPNIPEQIFRLRDRQALTNPAWWSDSEPIWVTAAKQGRISSTLFWPG
ncbi:MAG: ectonucleotide pyrophosphatase/phosphodiesterase, partial [Burkholderiaceae bacterium]